MCCPGSIDAASSVGILMVMGDTDQVILAVLDEILFASIRHLSRLTHLSSATVYQRLMQSLGYKAPHIR
jgi:hypothetical protein